MAGQRGTKRSHRGSDDDDADVSNSTHSRSSHSKKRAKSNASAVQAILERAGRATTSFQAADSESNQNFRPNKGKTKQRTKSGTSTLSTSTVTASKKKKGKEAVHLEPEPLRFGRVYIFTDGLHVESTKTGTEFFFGTKRSNTAKKPIPDPAVFDRASHLKTAAICDRREPLWSLELDMEVNEVLTQFGHNLPELIAEIRKDQTPNRKYNKDIDPDYREFLPPLIPLVRSGNRHLTISAGALKYPDTSFSEQINRCMPDRSKGGPGAVYNHCLYFVTRTHISQKQIASWSDDQDQSQSPITSFGSDHEHEDISDPDGSGEDSNGDDKEGSDDDDMDSRMVYRRRLRSRRVSSIDSSNASPSKPGPSTSQVIDIEDSSEDEDNIRQRLTTTTSSEPGTPPALANDNDEMNIMFSSMATVSNDPTILVNPYELKSFKF